ncbi:hypothetical protein E1B28_005677 [Marasmius oreades]|uniref:Protein kinase domain-containing protein n=1 Tax=Marasmius oreades TaxID=181124 RepID=A0A9P7S4A9_9AGAR|nr:uncharacterized protein E1B28_005677 [Marasmius oreades]KAG7094870.1 hypothetical protein E1B28_005677 [Marasmius oreades]
MSCRKLKLLSQGPVARFSSVTSGLAVYAKIITADEPSICKALESHNPGSHRIVTPPYPIQRLGESDLYMLVAPNYGDYFILGTDESIIRVSLGLCEALSFLHSHHIAHLDVKFPNIALDRTTETLTLIDLGGAMQIFVSEGKEPLVNCGLGDSVTPEVQQWYTDPDIARPQNPYKADVWAAGNIIEHISNDTSTAMMVGRFGKWMQEARPLIGVAIQQARLEEWQPATQAFKDGAVGELSYPIISKSVTAH